MENNVKFGAPLLGDISGMIPREEMAVAPAASGMLVNPLESLLAEIPEDERAQIEQMDGCGLEKAKASGCFQPINGMYKVETASGFVLYIRLCVEPDGNRFIVFRQQYDNGTFSEKMRIPQAELLLAARFNFVAEKISEARLKGTIGKFILEITKEYYNKCEYPHECMDIKELLETLLKSYSQLGVEDNRTKMNDPEYLYRLLVKSIRNLGPYLTDEHRAYYALDREQLRLVADDMEMRMDELLKRMKEFGFLYLTESSKGFQTCVRLKGDGEFLKTSFTGWCYCILKFEYLAGLKMQDSQQ